MRRKSLVHCVRSTLLNLLKVKNSSKPYKYYTNNQIKTKQTLGNNREWGRMDLRNSMNVMMKSLKVSKKNKLKIIKKKKRRKKSSLVIGMNSKIASKHGVNLKSKLKHL